MASEVSIVNRALILLGDKEIVSFDDNNKGARLATRHYADIRDEMLQEHPWNFAMRRDSLAANVTSPAFEFARAFDIPTDCLRVHSVYDNTENLPWKVEGRQILTNLGAPLQIRYIASVEDVMLMTPQFREALSARIALEWVEAITGSRTLEETKGREYLMKVAMARSMDGQEGTTDPLDTSDWLDARW